MGLATKVLLGLVLGVASGIFFGERIAPAGFVGDAFVLLLQMTVLPYIVVSLIHGLGRLTPQQALLLFKRAGIFLPILWGIAIATVLLMPFAFPSWPAASFFTNNLTQTPEPFDFLGLFIPANPFRSLANSIVPSVVVFSLALGIALIGVERKDGLMQQLGTLVEAIGRVTTFVVRLAPYGVFGITARAAGTMRPEELAGVQVYVILYVLIALVLALWMLPGLVAALTPLTHRNVIWLTRTALITAFATGSLFVVIAVLAEKGRELLGHIEGDMDEAMAQVDVVVPTSFTFPSAGKLLTLSFLPFAGWLSGFALSATQYVMLIVAGMPALFSHNTVAVPFLLDLLQVPADTFQLFLVLDNVVGLRLMALVGAMHVLALALLTGCSVVGKIQVRPVRLARWAIVSVLLVVGVVGGVRMTFTMIGHEYEGYRRFVAIEPLFPPLTARTLDQPADPLPREDRSTGALQRIRDRGFLRVGYFSDALPYAFQNENGHLVGLDIEMGHLLAADLGVGLELVRVERGSEVELLNAGYLDTVMSAYPITTDALRQLAFPTSHRDETMAFIVPDHLRQKFSSRESVKSLEGLRLAVPAIEYFVRRLEHYLPEAEIVPVKSPRPFLRGELEDVDALVFTAEGGSAWTLVYPGFSVAVPQPDVFALPLAYPVARSEDEFVRFLSAWIELRQKDQTIDRLFAHWILGEATTSREPRWSVIHDVLGWVD